MREQAPAPHERRGPKAWIWAAEGETFGLSIDSETGTLRWFVNAGCLCDHDDSTVDQTPAAFLASGVPGVVAEPDLPTLSEMRAAAHGWFAEPPGADAT